MTGNYEVHANTGTTGPRMSSAFAADTDAEVIDHARMYLEPVVEVADEIDPETGFTIENANTGHGYTSVRVLRDGVEIWTDSI